MAVKYAYQNYDSKNMARSAGTNLRISLKKTVETARAIQGKKVNVAIAYLERVTEQKAVVPYRRYRAEMAHQRGKGIDTGGFPVNVARELLKLVKSAKKNAEERELGNELIVKSVSARKGATRYHYGRYSGRQMKSTAVEVILAVKEKKSAKKAEKKEESK